MVDISTLQKKNLINPPKLPFFWYLETVPVGQSKKLEVILKASSSLTYSQSASPITSSFKTSQVHAFLFPCHYSSSPSHHRLSSELKGLLSSTPAPSLPNHKWWLFEMYTNHSLGLPFPVALRINKPKPLTMAYRPSLGPIYLSVLIPITITHPFTRCQSQRPF